MRNLTEEQKEKKRIRDRLYNKKRPPRDITVIKKYEENRIRKKQELENAKKTLDMIINALTRC